MRSVFGDVAAQGQQNMRNENDEHHPADGHPDGNSLHDMRCRVKGRLTQDVGVAIKVWAHRNLRNPFDNAGCRFSRHDAPVVDGFAGCFLFGPE